MNLKNSFFENPKLISFCFLSFLNSASNSVIIPFYPIIALANSLNQGEIGLILATAPIGALIFFAFSNKFKKKKRKYFLAKFFLKNY